jgi:hypothetical protein
VSEVAALEKHFCPACGAEATWNAARQALVCPYCGTTAPGELASDGSIIKEHDLVAALRAVPEEKRGWGNDRVAVQCKSCQAITLFEPTRVAQRCDFCGSPAIVPYDKTRNAIVPESLLPFRISDAQVRESMRQWYGSHWLAPNRLKKAALTETLHGIYIPYWTFDARVHARWTADAGHYYYDTIRRSGRTERVRRIRWRPAAGELTQTFDDELVAATQGVHLKLLAKVQPFPTTELKPYDPGYVSGWVVEQYQLDLVAAAAHAKNVMDERVRAACARDVPGDTHRNLQVAATYSNQTFKHVLLPVWLLSYNYRRGSYQVLVNGVTGTIAGERPWSWIKILLAIIVALIVLAIIGQFEN